MISAKPTSILAGITLEGDYGDYYWNVKNCLLGVCYDVRHHK